MASSARPYGLRIAKRLGGGPPVTEEYAFSTAIDSIGLGDPVRFTSGKIMLATAGTRLVGSWQGYRVTKSTGEVVYGDYYASGSIAGGRDYTAIVTVDPNIIYSIQSTGAVNTSDINKNADFAAHTAANAQTQQSQVALANSMTTGTAQIRIVDISKNPDNAAGDSYTEVLVKINEHQFGPTNQFGETD